MATLRELVSFRNDLQNTIKDLSLDSVVVEKQRLTDIIRCRHNLPEYDADIDGYVAAYQNLLATNSAIVDLIYDSIKKVEKDIDLQVENLKQTSSIVSHFLQTNLHSETIIQTRIGGYSDWRVPGMQLQCRYFRGPNNVRSSEYANSVDRINSMVSNDPLYLIGNDINLLKEQISIYPDIYQRRLRLYAINDGNLSKLPQNQFGFILCWDYLNYLPISTIETYLKSILCLLRPGGVLMFSYNNCEIERSAQLVDQGEACWATSTILRKIVVDIGFEIITFTDLEIDNAQKSWTSWAEIKKPGKLQSIKLQQAIGQVLTK